MPPRPRSDVRTPEQQKSRDGDPRSRDSRNTQVCFSIRSCNHAGHPTPQPLKTTMPSKEGNGDYLASRAGQWPPPDPRPSGRTAWTCQASPHAAGSPTAPATPLAHTPTRRGQSDLPFQPDPTHQTLNNHTNNNCPSSTATYHATMPNFTPPVHPQEGPDTPNHTSPATAQQAQWQVLHGPQHHDEPTSKQK